MNREKLLFECIRLLILQIRSEQEARTALLQVMLKGAGTIKYTRPTDEEVESKISEIEEVLKLQLKNSQLGGISS